MAPIKTYSRLNSTNKSKINAFSIVADKPIKKKKTKIQIAHLPSTTSACEWSDVSLRVNKIHNMFDRVKNLESFKSVNYKFKLRKYNSFSESSELDKPSIEIQNFVHSPVIQRNQRKYRNTRCTKKSNVKASQEKQVKTEKNACSDKVQNANHLSVNMSSSLRQCNKPKKERTLERSVNSSLEIEWVPKHKPFGCTVSSSMNELNSTSLVQRKVWTMNGSFEPLFSKTFRNKYGNNLMSSLPTAVSSTPFSLQQVNIVDDTLSPIANRSNCHLIPECKKLIDITNISTPKMSLARSKNVPHKTLFVSSSVNDCVSTSDILGNAENLTKGKAGQQDVNKNKRVTCYITLRKRKVPVSNSLNTRRRQQRVNFSSTQSMNGSRSNPCLEVQSVNDSCSNPCLGSCHDDTDVAAFRKMQMEIEPTDLVLKSTCNDIVSIEENCSLDTDGAICSANSSFIDTTQNKSESFEVAEDNKKKQVGAELCSEIVDRQTLNVAERSVIEADKSTSAIEKAESCKRCNEETELENESADAIHTSIGSLNSYFVSELLQKHELNKNAPLKVNKSVEEPEFKGFQSTNETSELKVRNTAIEEEEHKKFVKPASDCPIWLSKRASTYITLRKRRVPLNASVLRRKRSANVLKSPNDGGTDSLIKTSHISSTDVTTNFEDDVLYNTKSNNDEELSSLSELMEKSYTNNSCYDGTEDTPEVQTFNDCLTIESTVLNERKAKFEEVSVSIFSDPSEVGKENETDYNITNCLSFDIGDNENVTRELSPIIRITRSNRVENLIKGLCDEMPALEEDSGAYGCSCTAIADVNVTRSIQVENLIKELRNETPSVSEENSRAFNINDTATADICQISCNESERSEANSNCSHSSIKFVLNDSSSCSMPQEESSGRYNVEAQTKLDEVEDCHDSRFSNGRSDKSYKSETGQTNLATQRPVVVLRKSSKIEDVIRSTLKDAPELDDTNSSTLSAYEVEESCLDTLEKLASNDSVETEGSCSPKTQQLAKNKTVQAELHEQDINPVAVCKTESVSDNAEETLGIKTPEKENLLDLKVEAKQAKKSLIASLSGFKHCTQDNSVVIADASSSFVSSDNTCTSTALIEHEDCSRQAVNVSSVQPREETVSCMDSPVFALPKPRTPFVLKPGKSYRRSLLQIRGSAVPHLSAVCDKSRKDSLGLSSAEKIRTSNQGAVCTCAKCKQKSFEQSSPRRFSVRVVPVVVAASSPPSRDATVLENYAANIQKSYINSNAFQDNLLLEEYLENLSLTREKLNVVRLEEPICISSVAVTARDIVLRRCGQTEPLPFEKCYPSSILQNCQKIGEGVYGEVFLFRHRNGGTCVMKVIPIEGVQTVNGERQKKFDEILSEIITAMELSDLRHTKRNNTTGFNELHRIACVQGKYPSRLLDLWELYEESRGSENDSPEIFGEEQLYIVLELANGGKDLEAFVFNNAQQSYAIFIQIACAIAVAESSLQFEHRDLHWGNVLVSNVDRNKTVSYCLDGKEILLPSSGVEVAIIDFTLSRITYDGVCIYNDLSLDPDLFTAKGDYQFDIYRLMKESNDNNWQRFQPYTNVLWLHYILDKMVTALRYKNTKTKVHKKYLEKLDVLKEELQQYKSVTDFVSSKVLMSATLS